MDVYFSQELSNSLYLLQYPLRSNDRPYDLDLGTLSEVKFKPNNELIEFTYQFDKSSPNYDNFCNMESRTNEIKLSSLKVPPKCNYAVGMFRENQIHLTPLKSVLQLRPNLSYIDQFDADKKKQDDVSNKDDEEKYDLDISILKLFAVLLNLLMCNLKSRIAKEYQSLKNHLILTLHHKSLQNLGKF